MCSYNTVQIRNFKILPSRDVIEIGFNINFAIYLQMLPELPRNYLPNTVAIISPFSLSHYEGFPAMSLGGRHYFRIAAVANSLLLVNRNGYSDTSSGANKLLVICQGLIFCFAENEDLGDAFCIMRVID